MGLPWLSQGTPCMSEGILRIPTESLKMSEKSDGYPIMTVGLLRILMDVQDHLDHDHRHHLRTFVAIAKQKIVILPGPPTFYPREINSRSSGLLHENQDTNDDDDDDDDDGDV
eukprot:3857819-Pyramimonas_sp.AAC.1